MTLGSWTWHGGAIDAAKRHFGNHDDDWIDLSTGINPEAWPGVADLAIDWHRLPEQNALADLEDSAAQFFGVDPRHVCAVPGTETGLRLVGQLLNRAGQYVAPGYRTHSEMFMPGTPVDLKAAMATTATLLIANPNNPDGRIVSRDGLAALLDSRGESEWLLVDEAYADCDPAVSITRRVGEDTRLIVFRSFGKFFGLPGVRLGFVLGPQSLLATLRSLLGSWPISAGAIAIGTAAYRDRDWTVQARNRLRVGADALDRVLRSHGYAPQGLCPLFRLVHTPNAPKVFERLARSAILTRPFADRTDWLRVGLPGDGTALDRLDKALACG